jgi:hypothetical protein
MDTWQRGHFGIFFDVNWSRIFWSSLGAYCA